MPRPLTVLLAAVLLPSAVVSAAPTWQAIGPQGGPTETLAVSGTTAYATTAGGLIASRDGGRSWSRLDTAPGRPAVVAIQGGDALHVWVAALAPDRTDATPGGVFESRDGGATWGDRSSGLAALSSPFVYAIAFSPDDQTPLLATQTGILALRDGAWADFALSGDEVRALAASPREPGVLLAGVDSYAPIHDPDAGILRSDDAGLTWHRVSSAYDTSFQFAFDAVVADRVLALSYGVVRSTDGGRSFARVGVRQDLTAIAAVADGSFLAASQNGVLRSVDGGETFQRVALGHEILGAVAAVDGGSLVAGERGVWRSSGNPSVFRPSSSGFSVQRLQSLAADGAGTVLVGRHLRAGVSRSRDAGAHWTAAGALAVDWELTPLLAAAPSSTETFYAANLDGGRVARSDDGGATWETLGIAGFGSVLSVDPNDDRTLYLAQSESSGHDLTSCTRKSSDGGATFTCLHAPWSDNFGRRLFALMIAVRPGDSSFVLDVAGGLARSVDGGAHWTFLHGALPTDVSATTAAFDPANPRRILVGTTNGVFLSTDDASHFERSSVGLPAGAHVASLVPDPDLRGVVYAGVRRFTAAGRALAGEVYRSADGGRSWRLFGNRLPREFTGALALDRAHDALYAITDGRGAFLLALDSGR